ncbi:hypothetical protein G6L37_03330 [Agrobacterium rubi]|nr:hypothetical protein [Agrobacterium rubi]NTF24404.1 hypothetical protein [Agrobacterium rubi]
MGVPWEDMILDGSATAEELHKALDRRNAEVARVIAEIRDGSVELELMPDDDKY